MRHVSSRLSQVAGCSVNAHGSPKLLCVRSMDTGAQYEISLDGVPRTYRDRHDLAVDAAGGLKRQNHRCEVAVTDVRTNERTVIAAPPSPFAAPKMPNGSHRSN